MKLAASVEFVWQLAGQEATRTGSARIEPDHFFAAVLKYAELPERELARVVPETHIAEEFTRDIATVRRQLAAEGINSTIVRRALRAHLGKGDVRVAEDMHRSDAAREMFDRAGRIAEDANSEGLTAEHLLAALLAAPTSAMRAVLAVKRSPPNVAPNAISPLVAECGKDLVQQCRDGKVEAVGDLGAPSKALLDQLTDARRRCIVLVGDRMLAQNILMTVASTIAAGHVLSKLQGLRLVDVAANWPHGSDTADHSARLYAEAAATQDLVLVIWSTIGTSVLSTELKESVCKAGLRCVIQMDEKLYESTVKADSDWRRHSNVMWLQQRAELDIPMEL